MRLLFIIILFLLCFFLSGSPIAYASEKDAIVVPHARDTILINGGNYYTEDHITQQDIRTSMVVSLMLFITGFGILKLPDSRVSIKETKSFTIPYLGDANSLL